MLPIARSLLSACLLTAALVACGPPASEAEAGESSRDDAPLFQQARRAALDLDEREALPGQRVAAWREAQELRARSPFVLQKLARALLDAQLQGEAVEVLARTLELKPEDTDTRRQLVRVLLDLGRDAEALPLLVAARDTGDVDADTLTQLAQLRDRAGDRDEARALLDEAVARWPDDAARALALRARFQLETGALDDAARDFHAALALRPDNTTALKGLADVARRQGDDARADHWDEVLGLMVDLTDNVVLRDDASFRKPRLRRLAELHPAWIAGWHELAGRMQAAGRVPEACEFVRGQFERLPELRAESRAELRARFCPEDS
ncbi:MAG: hypothetical protein DHS20C15_00210 [Planctomycetota bacterium]|nr:MAG: hypothetical protein DHS20C15_00210 [Planctomycetota bacterium]